MAIRETTSLPTLQEGWLGWLTWKRVLLHSHSVHGILPQDRAQLRHGGKSAREKESQEAMLKEAACCATCAVTDLVGWTCTRHAQSLRMLIDDLPVQVRWVPGGHVSAFLLQQPAFRTAILDSLIRLASPASSAADTADRDRPAKAA